MDILNKIIQSQDHHVAKLETSGLWVYVHICTDKKINYNAQFMHEESKHAKEYLTE